MIWLFALALAVHLAYWLALGAGLHRARAGAAPPAAAIPISVVVAARDEEQRIGGLLAHLADQAHEPFEVIVVDDASVDATPLIVERRARDDPRVRLVRVSDPQHPRKKHALTAGIAAARHERLAFTDADCRPRPGWLAAIAAHAAADPASVLVGYGPVRRQTGALNLFVRYETWLTALMTAASAGLGRPFMAVGRNFSYPKSLFDRLGGFASHRHSLSGDDDLLVQQAHAAGAPVRYLFAPASFVESDAPSTWRAWLRQKLRHTSAGRFYGRSVQAHLGLFHLSNVAVWVAPLFLGWAGAGLLAGRFLVQRAVLRRAAEAFHVEHDLMIYQPVLDLGYLFYNSLVAPAGVVWGGRTW